MKVNNFRRKSTFLGKESTSLVKVVNYTGDEIVNQIRMDKQVLKTRPKKSQPFSGKDTV